MLSQISDVQTSAAESHDMWFQGWLLSLQAISSTIVPVSSNQPLIVLLGKYTLKEHIYKTI